MTFYKHEYLGCNMNFKRNSVFIVGLILAALVAFWAVVFNQNFSLVANSLFAFFTTDFAWLYLFTVTVFVVFSVAIAASKWGKMKLGPDDSTPDYATIPWFAMLFGCGMGIGLVFYGVAEPISHYVSPTAGLEPFSDAAANFAIRAGYVHWGLHPWACFVIVGLALAYFQFRKGKPGLISSTMIPLVGEKGAKGTFGKLCDMLAVFATIAGICTSLGLGTLQINSGLNYMFGIPSNLVVQIGIIIIISVIYIGTAILGIEKGISVVSNINLYLAVGVMALAFIIGPKIEILNNFVGGVGNYMQNFIDDSLMLDGYGDNSWVIAWRVFYWAWWIAWAPFVGSFIARISRGRTIREFVAGVLIVPTVASVIWFAIMGSCGLHLAQTGVLDHEALTGIAASVETAVFTVFQHYPLGILVCIIILILVITFFVTSANSGTFVLAMLTSRGNLNPPNSRKLLWGIVQSALAVGLLLAGGLKPLQTISIVAAFPFMFIMIAMMVAIVKALSTDDQTPNVGDPDFVPDPDMVAFEGGYSCFEAAQDDGKFDELMAHCTEIHGYDSQIKADLEKAEKAAAEA